MFHVKHRVDRVVVRGARLSPGGRARRPASRLSVPLAAQLQQSGSDVSRETLDRSTVVADGSARYWLPENLLLRRCHRLPVSMFHVKHRLRARADLRTAAPGDLRMGLLSSGQHRSEPGAMTSRVDNGQAEQRVDRQHRSLLARLPDASPCPARIRFPRVTYSRLVGRPEIAGCRSRASGLGADGAGRRAATGSARRHANGGRTDHAGGTSRCVTVQPEPTVHGPRHGCLVGATPEISPRRTRHRCFT